MPRALLFPVERPKLALQLPAHGELPESLKWGLAGMSDRAVIVVSIVGAAVFGLAAAAAEHEVWASAEKPCVVIKLHFVGDKVSQYAHRFPDLPELAAQMERSLLAARRLAVVTRDKAKLRETPNEQDLPDTVVYTGNAAESGHLEAADYPILAAVCDFVIPRSTRPVANIANNYVQQGFEGGLSAVNVPNVYLT